MDQLVQDRWPAIAFSTVPRSFAGLGASPRGHRIYGVMSFSVAQTHSRNRINDRSRRPTQQVLRLCSEKNAARAYWFGVGLAGTYFVRPLMKPFVIIVNALDPVPSAPSPLAPAIAVARLAIFRAPWGALANYSSPGRALRDDKLCLNSRTVQPTACFRLCEPQSRLSEGRPFPITAGVL